MVQFHHFMRFLEPLLGANYFSKNFAKNMVNSSWPVYKDAAAQFYKMLFFQCVKNVRILAEIVQFYDFQVRIR